MFRRLTRFVSFALLAAVLMLVAACGGDAATSTPVPAAPTATTAPVADAPTATTAPAEPTATTAPAEPTATTAAAEPTATTAAAEPGVTPSPTAVVMGAADGKPFKVWWYETADSAMGASWGDALKDFSAKHPDLKVEFELKTFDQIQQTGQMVLNSSDVPDVMEINKGNATAGLYAKQGLLTDLSDVATQHGWDKILNASLQATSRYDDRGIMGNGKLYGVTTYGEFVMLYYNKDMFDKAGIAIPTTYDEFIAACDAFVKAGIVPIALGGGDKWPVTQNFYELALYKANRDFINNYIEYAGDVDFHGPEFTYAATELQDMFKKGYFDPNATGVTYDDTNAAFEQGKYPMHLTGSWMFGTYLSTIKDFQWGLTPLPGKQFNTGSGGNLLVVPQNSQNKDLAYEFLDLALATKAQTIMANTGGIPVNADLSQITDQHTKDLNAAFSSILKNDGLAFYPDWPAPGYMDVLGGGLQDLITQKTDPSTFLDTIAGPWKEYKDSLP